MQHGDDRTMGSAKCRRPMGATGFVAREKVPDEGFLVVEMPGEGEKCYGTEHETFYPTPKFAVLGKRGRGSWCGEGAEDFEFNEV